VLSTFPTKDKGKGGPPEGRSGLEKKGKGCRTREWGPISYGRKGAQGQKEGQHDHELKINVAHRGLLD